MQDLMIDLLGTLDPVIVDRGKESKNYLHSLDFSLFTERIDIPNDSAILIVHVNKVRMSSVKGIGLILASYEPLHG